MTPQTKPTVPAIVTRLTHQWAGWLYAFVLVGLSIFIIARMLTYIATLGEDVPTNDYYNRLQMVEQIETGAQNPLAWSVAFLQRSGHIIVLTVGFFELSAALFQLNTPTMLLVGFSVRLWTVLIFTILLSQGAATRFRPEVWLAAVLLFFSAHQIDQFTFADLTATVVLEQLSFAVALGAAVLYPNRWAAAGVIGLMGVVGVGLGASGVPAVLVLALLLLTLWQPKRPQTYLTIALLGLAIVPYVLVVDRGSDSFQITEFLSMFLNLLGRPFVSALTTTSAFSSAAGGIGVMLLGITLFVIATSKQPNPWRPVAPALALCVYGLLLAGITAFGRVQMAPWYTSAGAFFWLGLVGCLTQVWILPKNATTHTPTVLIFAAVFFLALSGPFLNANYDYRQSAFQIKARSPASYSCLREYAQAPTLCQSLIFQWSPRGYQVYDFGQLLERRQLAMFASTQRFSAQGDIVLGRVVHQIPDPRNDAILWVDADNQPRDWRDYHRLRLVITGAATLTWQVPLPENARQIRFYPQANPSARIEIRPNQGVPLTLIGPNQPIDLTEYAGQTITLTFSATEPLIAARFVYPHIDVIANQPSSTPSLPALAPANTSLSPQFPNVPPASVFTLTDGDEWIWTDFTPTAADEWLVHSTTPIIHRRTPLNLCLADYSQLTFQMTGWPAVARMTVTFFFANGTFRSFLLEPLPNSDLTYAIDLNWLTGLEASPLVDIHFTPLISSATEALTLGNVQLFGRDQPTTQCFPTSP